MNIDSNIDPSVLLILIGSIFLFTGLSGKLILQQIHASLDNPSLRVISSILGLIILVIGIIGPSNLSATKTIINNNSDSNSSNHVDSNQVSQTPLTNNRVIYITNPTNGSEGGEGCMIRGIYEKKIKEDIWVLVWPENAPGVGWPQSDDAMTGKSAYKNNGNWSVYCHFGGPPQEYDIVVYKATAKASKEIEKTLISWAKSNSYPGLRYLPGGLTEMDRITVRKR